MRWIHALTLAAVLVLAAGSASAGSLLYAPGDADDPAFRTEVAGYTGDVVHHFNAMGGTPTLGMLQNYDAVFTWVGSSYLDAAGFGDVLADYVDGGGRVILGAFTAATNWNDLQGRIMTSGYSPVYSPSGESLVTSTPGEYTGGGSYFFSGVSSFTAEQRDDIALLGTGLAAGYYTDGVIALAYQPDLSVFYLNGSGGVYETIPGDAARLVANLVTASPNQATAAPLPPGSLPGLAMIGLLALLRRRKARRAG